jgi:hypothetical protein
MLRAASKNIKEGYGIHGEHTKHVVLFAYAIILDLNTLRIKLDKFEEKQENKKKNKRSSPRGNF